MSESPKQPLIRWLGSMALAAVAYYVGGRLGLMLAIPPGYATAVWPGSGVALAALLLGGLRCWPGVWLGSFLINVPTGFAAADFSTLQSLAVPLAIATGATLQAILGERLIRRFVGSHEILDAETEVISLLFLGGPVACLANAVVGVAALHLAGKIDVDGIAVNVATWWVGDTIGVIIFTPLILMWARRPWIGGPAQRLWVSGPLVILFALVVLLFLAVSRRESERMHEEFDGWNARFVEEVTGRFDVTVDALAGMGGLFSDDRAIDRATFDDVAAALLERNPDLLALSWNPVVPDADVPAFEKAGRADYGSAFRLQAIEQPMPPTHVAVRFIAPLAGNAPALGLDTASDPKRAGALRLAEESGREALTGPVVLIQDPQRKPGLLLVLPVRGTTKDAGATGPLRGYVVAAMHSAELIGPAAQALSAHHVRVVVTDGEDPTVDPLYAGGAPEGRGGYRHEATLAMAGRRWNVASALSETELLARRSWETWGVLAGGLLFVGLLGMFLIVVAGRGRQIEQLIEKRTMELRRTNTELSRELTRGEKLQQETQRRAADLAAVNRELEQFAYIVSHDLQAPLRSIGSFAQLLDRKSAGDLDGRGREYLGLIREGVSEMQKLIEALLRMSRISRGQLRLDVVQVGPLVQRICEQLRADIEQTGAEVTTGDLPRVYADPELLGQVFQNLIGNAIKFHRPDVPPRVRVTSTTEAAEWRFSVADNGTGLSPQNVERLFQVFRRFHAASQYPGTGIGLALSRKIVQLHGGRIWAESVEGEGTTFHFSLPLESGQSG